MTSKPRPVPPPSLPEPETVGFLRESLLAHYDAHGRSLPWRGETDPYRIWVSEVMLQQTRVETVIPFYKRWLERFPDVTALAQADLDDVLLAWQGLGYYRRARALHGAAAVVREAHGGEMPQTVEGLRSLPGVGEYTAGAVASIAYDAPVAAVDGNVKRVFARLFDVAHPRAGWLRDMAATLVDPARPGDWNQALMDLGATVCTPRAPACAECPLRTVCRARGAGTQEERPAPPRRKAVPRRTFVAAVAVNERGEGLVVRRGDQGLLAGLWAFPDREAPLDDVDGEDGGGVVEDGEGLLRLARRAAADAGATLRSGDGAALEAIRHRFTHIDATYVPVVLAGGAPEDENRRWVPLDGPWPVALPVAQQKISRAVAAALRRQ